MMGGGPGGINRAGAQPSRRAEGQIVCLGRDAGAAVLGKEEHMG